MRRGQTEAEISSGKVDNAHVVQALEGGATLLVPNVRAARRWTAIYDRAQQERSKSWRSARILPWGAWTSSLWDEALLLGADTRVRLNRVQEEELWSQIVRRAPTAGLAPVAQQAQLCASALVLLGNYDTRGTYRDTSYGVSTNADLLTFRRWHQEFEDLCDKERLLPAPYVEQELAELIRLGKLPLNEQYLLDSLDDLLPSHRMLLEAMRHSGTNVVVLPSSVMRRSTPSLLRCDSVQQEMEQCACWARTRLEEEPDRTVALVVPGLSATASDLQRELRAVLAPDTFDVTQPNTAGVFEFSSGRSLRQLPMVQDALHLLRWCAEELPLQDAGALLRSRHLALMSSPERGAALHTYVLQRLPLLRRTISLQEAAKAAPRGESSRLAALEREAARCRSAKQPYGWWTDTARELLKWAGWPRQEALDSEAFQAVDRWNDALDQVASLDLVSRSVNMETFLARLQAVAGALQFAPENRGAPVQVLTVEEVAGSTFDDLWFLHADAESWPTRATPHPLLPWRLQQDMHMPGTDTARDEAAASATLHRLVDQAGTTRFSYAHAAPEGERTPSPIIERLVQALGGAESTPSAKPERTLQEKLLTVVPDPEPLPPLLLDQSTPGGAAVLTAQSECGFKAFAEHRLFTKADDQPDAGLSPMERGNHIHSVLQKFWGEVKNQRTLKEISARRDEVGTSVRDTLLRRCITEVFREAPPSEHAWDAAYMQVQKQRLFTLLSAWLDRELCRKPFEVIITERDLKGIPLGPLLLDLRVDRVDRVSTKEGEATLLIDYKTGPAAARDWLGERPKLPQLPVYALASEGAEGLERVDGLAFGVVRVGSGNMKLEGLAAQPGTVLSTPRNVPDFSDQVEEWRRDLLRLAEAYAAGEAMLNPREFPQLCDRCAQRMLCRVEPATVLESEDTETEQEDEAAAW